MATVKGKLKTQSGDILYPETSVDKVVGLGATIIELEEDGSTTAGTWKAKTNAITALVDGQVFLYKIAVAGAATTTLTITANGTSLGAKTVYRVGTTKLTTQYPVGHYLLLVYNSLNTCFRVVNDSDANSYALVRQYQYGANAAGSGTKRPLLARYNTTNNNGSYDTAYTKYHTDTTLDTSNAYLYAPKVYSGGKEVVVTDDSRLSDSRPASDVSAWAKAATKPSYSWSEITDKPTLPDMSEVLTKTNSSPQTVTTTDNGTVITFNTHDTDAVTIRFAYNNGTSAGYFGFLGTTAKIWDAAGQTSYTLIHSGNISSQSVNYATSAGRADYLYGEDTRSDTPVPSNYNGRSTNISTEFKQANAIDFSSNSYYGQLITATPWSDSSGGYPVQFFVSSNNEAAGIRFGTGASSWSTWHALIHDGNIGSYALPLSGGTMTGTINTTENTYAFDFRPNHDSYHTRVAYETAGNEALVFTTKNEVTSFIFANGVSSEVSSDQWAGLTPGLQVKNNCVAIGKLIADGVTPTYKLDVNGTANATTIYENGTSLANKYIANAGDNPAYGNGNAITQPSGEAKISIRTTTGSADAGILMLSQDCAYLCNSGDSGFVFAVWNTDHTLDFSENNLSMATFAVLENDCSIKGNTVIHAGNIGSYALPLSGGEVTDVLSVASNDEDVTPPHAAIEIRERGRGQTTIPHTAANSPRIGFHWGGRYFANFMFYNQHFSVQNSDATAYVDFYANDLYENETKLSDKYALKSAIPASKTLYVYSFTIMCADSDGNDNVNISAIGVSTSYMTGTSTINAVLSNWNQVFGSSQSVHCSGQVRSKWYSQQLTVINARITGTSTSSGTVYYEHILPYSNASGTGSMTSTGSRSTSQIYAASMNLIKSFTV